ncbi:alpha-N-acetylglucosaminidase [Gautieria morchelliformis]|nr:alpha-N-acetylglucosaminidase [Gautieria morchelliformis]
MRFGVKVPTILVLCLASTALCSAWIPSPSNLDGIHALVRRRIPKHTSSFNFELTNGSGDSFVVSDSRGKEGGIVVQCTTISACARGLYTYLTRFGGVDIFWTGSRLDQLPAQLPSVGTPVEGSAVVPYRYHFNTVTFDYTAAFYTFDEWSLLLDWMALRGVNLPLAWDGYEYILVDVFRGVGLSEADISAFLSGPAFQAWNRFGNIQGSWGGPLPQQWISDQFTLQKQILQRMVELGMTPVLPSFTGFVPSALKTAFPNASIVAGSEWSGFPSSITNDSFLEPFDPLYAIIQKSFITKQLEAYGNISHIYTLDQYNENSPFSGDLNYLHNVSLNTFNSLRAADPDAVWLMQAWLFFIDSAFWTLDRIASYLGGVPGNDSMILLDLYSEAQPQWQRTSSYFGKSWIWCELHDFGGSMGFEGNLATLTTSPLMALHAPGSSMKGFGLTMEGQEGNEIVYDLLLDQAWSSSSIDISSYVSSWVSRRYQVKNLPPSAQQAWTILSSTVYNNTDPNTQATVRSILELAPSLTGLVNRTGPPTPTELFYDTNSTILPALKLLVQASKQNTALQAVPEFAYDVVDVARQLLANRFLDVYEVLVARYNTETDTAEAVAAAGNPLLTILSELDRLLLTNEHFLLSSWIRDARNWANGPNKSQYAAYLEYNARNQITLWGPDGEISDYASKQWAGLVGSYYLPRWEMFTTYLQNTKKNGEVYNSTLIAQQLLAFGQQWDNQTWGEHSGEMWGTHGDTWQIVDEVVEKYT